MLQFLLGLAAGYILFHPKGKEHAKIALEKTFETTKKGIQLAMERYKKRRRPRVIE